ncbi:hypothetical protein GCM10025869_26120 [Homoserinibacter gongjuensis]|uniref:ABC transporter domain-containing protein n=1 Tax=Homoserinibacter gongjuensis TaxID=1162968 RepID=A0ABQ6JUV1_9MICO|nr:hypothetical protein GCM10025869_26120 [Homoserinibacter gongjuensis]
MDAPLIELSGIVKSFGPVSVLKGVNLKAYAGKVTALVGDNGAGKSTLIKGLAGVQPYDGGEVRFEGKVVHLHSPRDASHLGIEVVYQDLALCDNLDIVQNMFLGREEVRGVTFDEGQMEREASETLRSLSVRTVKSVRQKVSSSRVVSARPSRSRVRCSRRPSSWCSTSPPPRSVSPRPSRCSTSCADSPTRASP